MNFIDLLNQRKPALNILEGDYRIVQQFLWMADDLGLYCFEPNEERLQKEPSFILLGLAVARSRADLELLDAVTAKLLISPDPVLLFDIPSMPELYGIETYFPSPLSWKQSPVVGRWVHGDKQFVKTGEDARKYIIANYRKK